MAPAYVSILNHQIQILNYGHLYLEYYVAGVAQGGAWPMQAGPQYGVDSDLLLQIQNYAESVYTDASVDITPYVNAAGLVNSQDGYAYNDNINNAPYYGLATLNSNAGLTVFYCTTVLLKP